MPEKYSVTGKLLRRAVSCIPSLASKHLIKEVAKEQARMTNGDSGDTGDNGGTVDAGDTLSTTKLESVEEIESQETQASNGSIGDASTATDVNQNSCRMRPVLKRRAMMLFPDSSVPTAVSEESEEPCDDCVSSSQEANMSSSAQRIASWFVPWRWRGTLLQKLRYIFSCLIFMCGIIMFVFVFVPTRKGLKMDSNAQAVEVDDILKSYTSLRHHAAPPV
ncbi:hypothetical protein LSAT2_013025 [Lamellibrachia satsuma]|nr:hypothetical protein LSAT2_013025 [Lamellibrachia satsuma]